MDRRVFLKLLGGAAAGMYGCTRRINDPSAAIPLPGPAAAGPLGLRSTAIDPALAAAAPRLTRRPVVFTDVTAHAGIHWSYNNGATGRKLFVETTGGGVAFFDYNNDGLLDIFVTQGGPAPGATKGEQDFPTRSALYRNNGDGTFTDVTTGSGLDHYTGYGQGVSAADYNNDGLVDLYVTTYGGSHLFRNNGDGTFTDATEKAGLSDIGAEMPWPLSAAWADYDNDGHLDLFVCHYARWSLATDQHCAGADGKRAYCRPQVYDPSHSRLYHNRGDGTFEDVSQRAGLSSLLGKSMGAAWFDYDDDGWMDLFVTNDTNPNFLLHNNRDGTFTDVALLSGVALGVSGEPLAGMGVAIGDYDNDGREDVFVVNFAGQPKSVFHNMGQGQFENQTVATGVGTTDLNFLAFGVECLDYDLDGYKDFVVGNGNVLDDPAVLTNGATYAQSQQLFHNQRNGTFAEDLHSLGNLVKPRVTRGLAIGDYDNDGDVDILMVEQNGLLQLFRNDGGNSNRWITLRLEGVHSNRDAIGAKVTLHSATLKQTQWVRGGSSYCSHSDIRLTFGLGSDQTVESLQIRWPRGRKDTFSGLASNRFYYVREGSPPIPDPRVRTGGNR